MFPQRSSGGTVRKYSPLSFLIYCSCASCLMCCTGFDWKSQDTRQIRKQFHLPERAIFISLDSNPKEPGWFGREGLRIEALVQFSNEDFEHYAAGLENKEEWKPVPFLHYSPDRADEYSPDALSWKDLPLPGELKTMKRLPATLEPRRGKYYCSAIVTVPDGRLEHNPAAFKWKNLGRSCLELSAMSEHPTILVFGVLDYDAKTLRALIRFSG